MTTVPATGINLSCSPAARVPVAAKDDPNVVIEGTPAFACVPSENTIPAAGSVTVPVNVGEASGAFKPSDVVTVDAKFASSPSAAASSSSVLSAAGAPVSNALTCDVASAIASAFAVAIAVACAVETGLAVSAVSSADPSPTIVFVIPDTVPVNVGEARLAFRSSAVCVAVETGFSASVVLSTFARPTSVFVIPVG